MVTRRESLQSPFDAACVVDSATFVVGTEDTNVINVGIQLRSPDYSDLGERGAVHAYLSTDSHGDNVASSAPSGGVAVGTDGLAIALVTGKVWLLVSESDGDIDLNITEGGAATFYLVLVMPDGGLMVSGAITFAA